MCRTEPPNANKGIFSIRCNIQIYIKNVILRWSQEKNYHNDYVKKKKNIQTKKGLAMRIMQVGANHVTMPIQLAYIIKSIASVERDIKILP